MLKPRKQQKAVIGTEPGMLGRRQILGWLGAGALLAHAPAAWAAGAPRWLAFYNTHTGESLTRTYWDDGVYRDDALAEIDFLLRDHRSGDVAPIDLGLLNLLFALRSVMESDAAYEVISGYRSPKTNAALREKSSGVAKKSLHMLGKAIDLRLPGSQLPDLRAAAISLESGGVGYYPKSDFIHVDIGRVRQWQ